MSNYVHYDYDTHLLIRLSRHLNAFDVFTLDDSVNNIDSIGSVSIYQNKWKIYRDTSTVRVRYSHNIDSEWSGTTRRGVTRRDDNNKNDQR